MSFPAATTHTEKSRPATSVVVVHPEPVVSAAIAKIVMRSGLKAIELRNSQSLLHLVNGPMEATLLMPTIFILGVALVAPPIFELCPLLKESDANPTIVLVGSTHSPLAYKRSPTSLYGADFLVEEQHLESQLLDVVRTA